MTCIKKTDFNIFIDKRTFPNETLYVFPGAPLYYKFCKILFILINAIVNVNMLPW